MKNIRIKFFSWLTILIISVAAIALYLWEQSSEEFKLTNEETQWLKDHPVIRIAPNKNFLPVEFFDENGNYQGLASDIIKLIEQKIGIKFTIVCLGGMQETFAGIQNRTTDVISATAISPQRTSYLVFSQPFIRLQKVIVVHSNDKRKLTPDSLKGVTVAIVKNSSVHEDIVKRAINAKLDTVSSALECLYEVSLGHAEAAIMNLATAAYLIRSKGLYNLRISGDYSLRDPYVMAVRKDWPTLVHILNKALAAIPNKQHDELISKWLGLKVENEWYDEIQWQWFAFILAAISLLAIATLFWNRSLKKQVQFKTKELQQELNDRLKAEKALVESEDRFRVIVESLPEAIFITNLAGEIIEVNSAACDLLGYKKDEFLKSNVRQIVPVDQIARLDKLMVEIKEKLGYFETVVVKKDKALLPVEATLIQIYIQEELRFLGVVRDITFRKQAEEKLIESREKLIELNAAKDRFFSIISHDLRSPFQGLLGLSEILVHPEQKISEEDLRKIYIKLNSALITQFNLLQDLLKWSRIQVGRFEVNKNVLFVRATIHKVIDELKKNAEQKQIEISNEVNENLLVKSDENIISSVIRNLLSNAIKFSSRNKIIRVYSEICDNKMTLIVEDQGIGMNPSQIQKLFRIDTINSTPGTEKETGTGLGLLLVKEMLDLIHGRITLESRENVGSKFMVTLPMED